ncbi:hypothetical protein LA080_010973 [Diaporthe eres]|nr:hypothetical protein LA080_010973 [Diaporthe eres]
MEAAGRRIAMLACICAEGAGISVASTYMAAYNFVLERLMIVASWQVITLDRLNPYQSLTAKITSDCTRPLQGSACESRRPPTSAVAGSGSWRQTPKLRTLRLLQPGVAMASLNDKPLTNAADGPSTDKGKPGRSGKTRNLFFHTPAAQRSAASQRVCQPLWAIKCSVTESTPPASSVSRSAHMQPPHRTASTVCSPYLALALLGVA